MTKIIVSAFMLAGLTTMTGCTSWNLGQPITGVSRVPPPGLGQYQTSGQYYNNASASLPANGGTLTAANSGLQPAGGGLPSTNLQPQGFATQPNFVANNQSGVATASFRDDRAIQPVATAEFTDNSPPQIETGSVAEQPSLQWR